MPEWRDYMAT